MTSLMNRCRITPRMALWASLTLAVVGENVVAASASQDPVTGGTGQRAPISFEVNQGQLDASVRFFARHRGMDAYLLRNELVLAFTEMDREAPQARIERLGKGLRRTQVTPGTRTTIHMKLLGSTGSARAVGLDPLPGVSHYLIGDDPSRWRRNVPHYAKAKLENVYPGVDLVLHGESGRLEYDFVVAPDADASVVNLEFEGAQEASVNAQGDLVLRTERGQLRHVSLAAYQESHGVRATVQSRFVMKGPHRLGFEVSGHDRRRPVVIDPVIVYSTLVGGSLDEAINAIAADRVGNAYVTGATPSPDFPVTQTIGSGSVFVQKRDPNGALVYSTLIGASSVGGIAVDRRGRVYITYDGLVGRLNTAGDAFEYSTSYAGIGFSSIAVDRAGNAYVAGATFTRDLPLLNPTQPYYGGGGDMFLAKLNASGTFVFATYLGGELDDWPRGMAADDSGNMYVLGFVDHNWYPGAPRYPLTNPLWPTGFAFLAKIHVPDPPEPSRIVYSTLISGAAHGVAADREGNAYVAGEYATDYGLPPINASQPEFAGGGDDAFLMKIRPDGSGAAYSTYYGTADHYEVAEAVAVGVDGSAHMSGWRFAYDDIWGMVGSVDAFYVRFDPTGTPVDSAIISSGGEDDAWAIAVDPLGNAYVAGEWNWDEHNTNHQTTQDGFIIKYQGDFQDLDPDCPDCEGIGDVGHPVNVFSGAVWFNHTDAVVQGVTGINFTRSYNSLGTREPTDSAFGTGWTHPFEQNLLFAPAGLRLRQGNGTPMTFTSGDDVTYHASVPASDTSWIVKGADTFTRYFRDGSSEVYDSMGQLTAIRDAVGNETTLIWENDMLTGIRDASGRQLSLRYSAARIASLWGPGGLIASYSYGVSGLLERVTYADGAGYAFAYDTLARLVRVDDASGRPIETHTYDDQGRATTSEVTDGIEKITITYVSPSITRVTDALGNVAEYQFAEYGGMRKVIHRTGACITCGGADTEDWTYYPDGRMWTHTIGDDPPTTYIYYPTGEVWTVTDPLNRTTTYTYDDHGRMLTREAPGAGTTVLTQSAAGPLTVTVPVTDTESRTTTFTYKPTTGKLWQIISPQNKVTENVYDDLTKDPSIVRDPLLHETQFGYDLMGRREVVADALGHMTTTEHDVLGRVKLVRANDGTFTRIEYDTRGLRKSVTDPMGRKTQYTYDDYGRLETVLDPAGQLTKYGYDVMSRRKSLTDANRHITTFDYDEQGRLKTTTYPGNRAERATYYPSGRIKTMLDRKGITTIFHYDNGGRLRRKTYSDGSPEVTFDYDDADRLISASNAVDTVSRTYYLSGELKTETSSKNGTTLTYGYDTVGRRESLTIGTGFDPAFVTYGYDDASRLRSITPGSNIFRFDPDAANRPGPLTYPNLVVTNYTFDDLNRLKSASATLGAAVVTGTAYDYDAAGNRTKKTTADFAETYGYDPLYRLKSVDRGAGATWDYGYDAVGNRTSWQAESTVVKSHFSDRNELQSDEGGGPFRVKGTVSEPGTVTVAGVPAQLPSAGVFEAEVEVSAGPNDLLIEAKDATGNVQSNTYRVTVPSANATFGHDWNGNLDSKTDGTNAWIYEWTVENQLARVLKDGQELARFNYDALGRRVEKAASGVWTTYLYDGDDILQQTSGGTVTRYIHGPGIDEPLAQTDASGNITGYFHADGLGSIVATTDTAGTVTSTRRYDAYGNIEAGSTASGYAFTGREWDNETGLYYYRARYYDPKIGRFISEDPIGFAGGVNFYGYLQDNPVNHRDPSGLLVDAAYNITSGTLTIRDRDTGEMVTIRAESGGKPFGDPLPEGRYEILEQARKASEFFRLDPIDQSPRNDVHEPTGRDHFRLHKPGMTWGCVAAKDAREWGKAKSLIWRTETEQVEDNFRPWWKPKGDTQMITKYGELLVVK